MKSWAGLLGAVLSLCLTVACNAQQPLSQSAFRDAVGHELSERRPGLCIRSNGDSSLSVGRSPEACEEMEVSTAYIYGQYVADPAHQEVYVGQLVTTALNGIASLEISAFTPGRDRIVVVLRPDAYARTAGQRGERESSAWRPFAGDFVAMLVEEDNGQVRSLRGIDIERIGLSESQAWELALSNLRQRTGALERTSNESGAELVTAASGLAPSSLLLPEACTRGGADFDVFIVARDTFFYAETNKPHATAMLAGYAAQLVQEDEVYSRRLLSCLNGDWYASVFNGANAWLPEQAAH